METSLYHARGHDRTRTAERVHSKARIRAKSRRAHASRVGISTITQVNMSTSDADAVANLERVVLEALEIMDEKISKMIANLERKIDDAVARSFEGRGAATTKRFPKKRNAAAETSVGAKRSASTVRTTMSPSSESSSESKPNEEEAKDDSAKT